MYKITYEEIMEILKSFGRLKGRVWLCPPKYSYNVNRVYIKYDNYRRYYMSCINGNTVIRVPQDVFESNIKYLIEKGYTISF